MYTREETEYFRAKMKAARRIYPREPRPSELPTNREIRDRIQTFVRMHEDNHCDESPRLPRTETEHKVDRFLIYELLLLPLENVKEASPHHGEGDVLHHSLQVFDLAREARPYDEELLLAALLHDVGKGIDRRDHATVALEALDGFITPRTAWLIEHHVEARTLADHSLGVRARRRLEASDDFDELVLLAECDAQGRGVAAPELDEALDYLRELVATCGE